MRIVPAKGQYFAYRVLFGGPIYADSGLHAFGIGTASPRGVEREVAAKWAAFLHDRFGGEAYHEKEAEKLQQRWCFGETKILGLIESYFGFTSEEDAVLFLMKFKKRKK